MYREQLGLLRLFVSRQREEGRQGEEQTALEGSEEIYSACGTHARTVSETRYERFLAADGWPASWSTLESLKRSSRLRRTALRDVTGRPAVPERGEVGGLGRQSLREILRIYIHQPESDRGRERERERGDRNGERFRERERE